MKAERRVGIDLEFRLHTVLDKPSVNARAGLRQRGQRGELHTADAGTVEKNLAGLLDEGALDRHLDRRALLTGARIHILDVVHHRTGERTGGDEQEQQKDEPRARE